MYLWCSGCSWQYTCASHGSSDNTLFELLSATKGSVLQRVLKYLRTKQTVTGPISCAEMKNAEVCILCYVQSESFGKEPKTLTTMAKWENPVLYSSWHQCWTVMGWLSLVADWVRHLFHRRNQITLSSCLRVTKWVARLLMIIMITRILVHNGSCQNCILITGSCEHGQWSNESNMNVLHVNASTWVSNSEDGRCWSVFVRRCWYIWSILRDSREITGETLWLYLFMFHISSRSCRKDCRPFSWRVY